MASDLSGSQRGFAPYSATTGALLQAYLLEPRAL